MNAAELTRCLALLQVAEAILIKNRENVLVAHLSLVTERLRERVGTSATAERTLV